MTTIKRRAVGALRAAPSPLVSLGAAVTAAIVWLALAFTTGLTYHLMPAGPPLAAGVALRWARGSVGGCHHLRHVAIAIGVSLAAAGALAATGRPLDAPWLTVLAADAGGIVAVGMLNKPRE